MLPLTAAAQRPHQAVTLAIDGCNMCRAAPLPLAADRTSIKQCAAVLGSAARKRAPDRKHAAASAASRRQPVPTIRHFPSSTCVGTVERTRRTASHRGRVHARTHARAHGVGLLRRMPTCASEWPSLAALVRCAIASIGFGATLPSSRIRPTSKVACACPAADPKCEDQYPWCD